MTTGPLRVVAMSPTWFGESSVLGGGERYPENLARAVASAGGGEVEVTLVALGPREQTTEIAPGVRRTILPVAAFDGNPVDALSWEIDTAARGASLVHVHQAFTRFGLAAVLAAGLNGVPVVISDHGGPTLSGKAQAELRGAVDGVLAYSRFGAEMAGGATEIVPGGVDAEWFSPGAGGAVRDAFVYVGRILPHKRVERAIEALPAGARLVVCGSAPDEVYLKELHDLVDDRDVTFVTDADDAAVRDLYRSARAVVLLSEHVDRYGNFYRAPELMGLTVLEAAACGTPALVAATGALPEFVVDGTTGWVAADDARVADVLAELHDRPALADETGAAARAHLVGRWDLPVVGARVLDFYRRTIADHAAL